MWSGPVAIWASGTPDGPFAATNVSICKSDTRAGPPASPLTLLTPTPSQVGEGE